MNIGLVFAITRQIISKFNNVSQRDLYTHSVYLFTMYDLIVSSSQYGEQIKEQIYDVNIESNSSPYVLIIRVSLDQVVCVVYDVACEYDCC